MRITKSLDILFFLEESISFKKSALNKIDFNRKYMKKYENYLIIKNHKNKCIL